MGIKEGKGKKRGKKEGGRRAATTKSREGGMEEGLGGRKAVIRMILKF